MELFEQFLRNVQTCQTCPSGYGFSRSPNGAYYKFPPLIGAACKAKMLFVGINPRLSSSNQQLHDGLIGAEESFHRLARNRLDDGTPLIHPNAKERHYLSHMFVVQGVFGDECEFETVAAVTELFLCASTSAPALEEKSICAEKYLHVSLSIVKPQVVIAVGATVRKHLERHFSALLLVPLVEMEHPRFHFDLSQEERRRRLQSTISDVRRILG